MKLRAFFRGIRAIFLVVCFRPRVAARRHRPRSPSPGVVSSAEEGPMEGVLVGAKKVGSTITTTVVSDEHGRYRFPASKLTPGQYALRIRAVGYDLASPGTLEVTATQTDSRPETSQGRRSGGAAFERGVVRELPGTEQQKASIKNCTHCHTLERIMRTRAEWMV